MSGEVMVTVSGRLTADPELRFTPSGAAVCSFSVAQSPRKYNSATKQWEDGDTSFWRVSVWRQQAENVAESLTRGDSVVVFGTIAQRQYETREGEQRTTVEITAQTVAASLQWATAKVNRAKRASESQTSDETEDPWSEPAEETRPAPAKSQRNGADRSSQRQTAARR